LTNWFKSQFIFDLIETKKKRKRSKKRKKKERKKKRKRKRFDSAMWISILEIIVNKNKAI